MRHALFLPPFGELFNPRSLATLAATAESSGWDGVFLWDHVLRPAHEPAEIADPWICLAAMAMTTTRLRLGTLVTPPTRRRPIKLARETITLDHLSGGRLTLGLGLGVDTSGELTRFGEIVDPVVRGQRLDEAVEILCGLWSGERFSFAGAHFTVDDVQVLPTPVQRPRVPLWFAARGEARKPVRRAARYDGLVPLEVDIDGLRSMLDVVGAERGSLDGFDVAVPSGDRAPSQDRELLASMGVTWLLHEQRPGQSLAEATALASAPPA